MGLRTKGCAAGKGEARFANRSFAERDAGLESPEGNDRRGCKEKWKSWIDPLDYVLGAVVHGKIIKRVDNNTSSIFYYKGYCDVDYNLFIMSTDIILPYEQHR